MNKLCLIKQNTNMQLFIEERSSNIHGQNYIWNIVLVVWDTGELFSARRFGDLFRLWGWSQCNGKWICWLACVYSCCLCTAHTFTLINGPIPNQCTTKPTSQLVNQKTSKGRSSNRHEKIKIGVAWILSVVHCFFTHKLWQ